MAKGETVLELIIATLSLIKGSKQGEKRRAIRQAFKSYKRIKRIMRQSDGISAKEQIRLDELMYSIMEAQDKLLNF